MLLILQHQGFESIINRRRGGICIVAPGGRPVQPRCKFPQPLGIVPLGPLRRRIYQESAGLQLDMHLLPRVKALLHRVSPGGEGIDPTFQCVPVFAQFGNRKLAAPAVHPDRLRGRHRNRAPGALTRSAIQQLRPDHIMPIGKNIRFHLDRLAHHAFDRVFAAVNLRMHGFNHNTASARHLGGDGILTALLAYSLDQEKIILYRKLF